MTTSFDNPLLSVSPASRALAWPPGPGSPSSPTPPQCVFLQSSTRAAVSDGWGGSLPRGAQREGSCFVCRCVFCLSVRNRMRGLCPLHSRTLLSQPFKLHPALTSLRAGSHKATQLKPFRERKASISPTPPTEADMPLPMSPSMEEQQPPLQFLVGACGGSG